MNQTSFDIPFEYSKEEREEIAEQFRKAGKSQFFEACTEEMERAATHYLIGSLLVQPTENREALAKKHAQELASLLKAREVMIRECRSEILQRSPVEAADPILDIDLREMRKPRPGDMTILFKKFESGEIPAFQLAYEVGVRALDRLIEHHNQGSPQLKIMDGKKEKFPHRRYFIRRIAGAWAVLQNTKLHECRIGRDGSPMVKFVRAYLDPVTVKSDQCFKVDDDRQIRRILKELLVAPVE
ncbi:hypothetical protein RLW55_16970 [Hyphomicrobium sp. B1]|uniref:hypothetical protein n=1 Tax=Hyphomicrobium sp. B1 TaxID=3075651 RepID=UPI003C2BAA27